MNVKIISSQKKTVWSFSTGLGRLMKQVFTMKKMVGKNEWVHLKGSEKQSHAMPPH